VFEPRLVLGFALPDHEYAESISLESPKLLSVAFYVPAELLYPELSVTGRRRTPGTALVAVPEATVNKDYPSSGSICDVRRAGQIPIVSPEADPHPMK